MKKTLLAILAFTSISSFAAEQKQLCTVSLKWKDMIVFDNESAYSVDSLEQCVCAAKDEVVGTRLENKIKKVQIRFMTGKEKRCGKTLNRSKCVSYKYNPGSAQKFTVEELKGLDICN